VPKDTELANIPNPWRLLHIVATGLAMISPIENASHFAKLSDLARMDGKSSEYLVPALD
jgi:hypothetical protein